MKCVFSGGPFCGKVEQHPLRALATRSTESGVKYTYQGTFQFDENGAEIFLLAHVAAMTEAECGGV
jgi:hypothetical protein